MSVSDSTLQLLESHWAVSSIPHARRERAREVARYRLVQNAVGRQMILDFSERLDDQSNLERVALAYELAAIEGIDASLHPGMDEAGKNLREQAQAGAYRAYELRRALPIPTDDAERAFHILHRGALAYCSDRWTDFRRWLKENAAIVSAPSVATVLWDERVLYRLYDCWVRLFRKNQWDDLDRVREIVAGLREDQKQHEATLLESAKQSGMDSVAYRLVALYHWAKATEQLAVYMLQGTPPAIDTELDQHFESARSAAQAASDASLDVLLRWLHVAARRMVVSSIWWVAQKVNSRVTRFVNQAARKRSMFELLPPQRAALQEQGLLDQANQAVVVNLPTSGGKTVLAQFRMLQALNQFAEQNGWIAYVAPTQASVAQITRRLRTDFEPLGINVEYLSAAVDLDGCERALLQEEEAANSFHVLVSTPEKLNLLIRNRVVSEKRPLALVVVDEAHNIEDEERGLRVELLLATIKRDCPNVNYLLLMPFVPNAKELASWLGAGSGRTISLGTSAWQPNERIVGLFGVEKEASVRAGWQLHFETLITTPKTLHLKGRHKVGGVKPLAIPYSEAKSPTVQAGAMARVFSERGTSIAVAKTIPHCWSLARTVVAGMPVLETISPEIELACRFLAAEVAEDFELVEMLRHGVGVHHAGLSEETRAFIEWLAESGKLRVLCATTTIAQGINFPVASVFLASRSFPYGREMSKRAFWNLAGRAGRVGQDSVGVVGLAGGNDRRATIRYVQEATEDLVSRLVAMLREISDADLLNLTEVIHREQWSDFRSYIAHLYNEAKDLNKTLAEAEQALRNTFGYGTLQTSNQPPDRKRAAALLEAAKAYARELDKHPENASLADATGFDPEGVRTALLEMNKLEQKLKPSDWQPASLFGSQAHSVLPQLVGVMMQIPQIGKSLEEISGGGIDRKHIAALAKDWVNGKSIKDIAEKYFASTNEVTTDDISKACKGIYRALANAGTWGLAALSQMGTSGLDFKTMTAEDRMAVNNLPAMLYHGVNTEAAVLMRINAVPRSIAPKLGDQFAASKQGSSDIHNPRAARNFLRALSTDDWQKAAPPHSKMSGTDYRDVWQLLSGERI